MNRPLARHGAWLAIAVLCATPAHAQETANPGDVTATWAQSEIQARGAREFLWSTFDSEAWVPLLDGIAAGQSEWLNVAAQLRAVSDAHASEMLTCAISEALLHNPTHVLQQVKDGAFELDDACGWLGFLEYDDEATPSAMLRFVEERETAVSGVEDASLATQRDACLQELRRARADLAGSDVR